VQNPKRERAKSRVGKRQKVVLEFGNKDRGKWQAIVSNTVLVVDADSAR
jgi:hypothetical protein